MLTTLAAILTYIAAVIGSLFLFLYTVSRVVGREDHSSGAGPLLVVLAALLLVFFIFGGFLWFRFLSVAT